MCLTKCIDAVITGYLFYWQWMWFLKSKFTLNFCDTGRKFCNESELRVNYTVTDQVNLTRALACQCLICDLGVSGPADCCIIFRRAAPSLWRASLRSACSLCRPPPRLPLRLWEPGQAQPSGLAGSTSTRPTGVVAWTRPSSHNSAQHTDGQTVHWRSSITLELVLSKWIKRIPPL